MLVLEQMARLGEASITQLAQHTELHKSTVHRLLATLEATGLVRQNPATGHYRLGFKLMELGAAAIRSVELRTTAHAHLEELSRATGHTVHLGVLDRGEVVYVDKIEGEGSFRLYSQIGRRVPFHCTAMGKVLVSYLPLPEQRRLVSVKTLRRFTRRTIVEPDKLLQHLRQVAAQGFALDDGEHEELIHCLAAPIRDHTGGVAAAMSITMICAELPAHEVERMVARLLKSAAAISADLGFEEKARPSLL